MTSPDTIRPPSSSLARAEAHCDDLAAFVQASPSSYHAAREVSRRLRAAGYTALSETEAWPVLKPGGTYLVVRDGAVIAWAMPNRPAAHAAFAILGSHTDCTGFKLKPKPTTGAHGFVQAGVEIYGGPLLNAYLDRDLGLAGRIVLDDGTEALLASGPLLRIPQLAIHLDRKVNDEGIKLDRQQHTQPLWALGSPSQADLLAHLASFAQDAAGQPLAVDPASIAGYDIYTYDTQAPGRLGATQELLASGRLDNLASVHASVTALVELANSGTDRSHVAMMAAFDHEEIGSATRSGASGPFLVDVLGRIQGALGASDEDRARSLAGSWCLSADCGHSIHPNYASRHDPAVRPVLGGGVLLKINANQRYATDAHGAGLLRRLSESAGEEPVAYQEFVSNNELPCGSTIGPLTATRLGIRTVDIGVPLLSMHSPRELAAVSDIFDMQKLSFVFLEGRGQGD
ncbi:M18 family aminopeptidase [Micrococcales bacterium 31B]|nr:M18 family aminopeptidase [Micrococcales bacterium 31B]